MGKRRNNPEPAHDVIALPIHRPEGLVSREGQQPALVFPGPAFSPAGAPRLLRLEGGPIPSPQALRLYDRVTPGLAARLVEWAEQEARHRRAVERSLIRLSWGGLWCALVVTLVTVAGGMLLALRGRSTAGLIGVVGAVAGLVIVFVAGRRRLPPDTAGPAKAAG